MTATNAVIQGVLQGLTEFLPVSSSGHLTLFQYFTGQHEETGLMFTVLLHIGTLFAVFIAFYKTIWSLIKEFAAMIKATVKIRSWADFVAFFKQANPERRMIFLLVVSLLPMIASLRFLDVFDRIVETGNIIVVGGCFMITSILLFLADSCPWGDKTAATMKYHDSVIIGVIQAIAPMPGISRSGSTISMGLLVGLKKDFAVAFSFIMGIPPIIGATFMEYKNVSSGSLGVEPLIVLIGVMTSLVVGLLAIFMVRWLVRSERFKVFAYYTLVLGVLTIGIGIFERLTENMIQGLVMELLNYV
ncbi:MAG: undecaprenyl-diphosphate phosphatase [Oscillospiraceae bacterium]|nr:undecaprenyl-diphosphate phosphatase [Oscillospiraceae bacterium]